MTRNEFFKSLDKQTAPVYLFYGTEKYILRSAVEKLRAAVCQDDYDYTVLDKTATADEITEQCSTFSFAGGKKLVVSENYQYLTGKGEDEKIEEYINDPSDGAVLLFVCDAPFKTGRLYKLLQKCAVCIEFTPATEAEITAFIQRELKKCGRTASAADCAFLAQYTDNGLDSLSGELAKLCSAGTGNVTREEITKLCTPSRDYKIFKITDYVMEKQLSDALALSDLLLAEREQALYIIAILAKQLLTFMQAGSMSENGASAGEIAAGTGAKEYSVARSLKYYKRYGKKRISACIALLLKADETLKTSRMSEEVCMTTLITDMCGALASQA